ncbi:hypothetical protein J7E29_04895 [Streptomyces sp. ISL-90]|nr:hypothetical protein [Streptomyces sp. ISL-90]
MSEGRSAQGIDPRFDPRFQRGYVPSPESDGGAAVETPPPKVMRPARAAALPVPPAPGRLPPIAAKSTEPVEQAEHVATPPKRPEVGSADAAEPVSSGEIAAFDEPEPDTITRRWIVAAWVVAIGALGLGFWLFWSVAGDRGMYYGSSSIDPVLQQAAWTIAPPLMQAGGIGVVVLLAWQAIRRARRNARDDETERP